MIQVEQGEDDNEAPSKRFRFTKKLNFGINRKGAVIWQDHTADYLTIHGGQRT